MAYQILLLCEADEMKIEIDSEMGIQKYTLIQLNFQNKRKEKKNCSAKFVLFKSRSMHYIPIILYKYQIEIVVNVLFILFYFIFTVFFDLLIAMCKF